MKTLDFIIKCYFIYTRKKGVDGLYAALIGPACLLAWSLTFLTVVGFGFLLRGSFSLGLGFILSSFPLAASYIIVFRKLKAIYFENGRPLLFTNFSWLYYLMGIVLTVLTTLFMLLTLIALARFGNLPARG